MGAEAVKAAATSSEFSHRSIVTSSLPACTGLAPDLTWLAHRAAAGALDPQISWRGSWDGAADAIAALLQRRLHGKAVLEVS
ncbi:MULTISPECIES: hypothetical protein [unclassified Streptomyces]|uniref:hypothetical protein n=1 Tax=unclassified Streptomyces TaxID=2593676 RepID=UPI001C85F995|nr:MULTISPECIES: hypothetical protein [unclassified Streptomyces]